MARKKTKVRGIEALEILPRASGLKAVIVLDDGSIVKLSPRMLASFVNTVTQVVVQAEAQEAAMESKAMAKSEKH